MQSTETAPKERRIHFFPLPSHLLCGAARTLCFLLLMQLLPFPADRFRVLSIPPGAFTVRHHRADAFEESREPLSALQGVHLSSSSWLHRPSVALFPCASAPPVESEEQGQSVRLLLLMVVVVGLQLHSSSFKEGKLPKFLG